MKALVALLLIGWLTRSGHLDVGALRILIDWPWLLAMALGLFAGGLVVASLRFRVLLGLADVVVPLSTLFRLQMTAFFFNVVIPGNIGGDVVKALYVARDAAKEKRTTILLVTFVERLLGVVGLVLVGTLSRLFVPRFGRTRFFGRSPRSSPRSVERRCSAARSPSSSSGEPARGSIATRAGRPSSASS